MKGKIGKAIFRKYMLRQNAQGYEKWGQLSWDESWLAEGVKFMVVTGSGPLDGELGE